METITSGTSTERIVRAALLMVLMDAFGGLYLWDGHIGYPRENVKQLAALLGVEATAVGPPNAFLTASNAKRIAETLKSGEDLLVLTASLGDASIRHDGNAYFVGPGGWLLVELAGDRTINASWNRAGHTEEDLKWQKWIGYVLVSVGLLAMLRLGWIAATRATLSDEGLRLTGRPMIPWDAITSLQRVTAAGDDAVDLTYCKDDGNKTIRLDRYVYKEQRALVDAICLRKGFPNPLTQE